MSEDELTRLLERLGDQQFGGPEYTTIGAVSEATGASVADLADILRRLRAEDRVAADNSALWEESSEEDQLGRSGRPLLYGRRAVTVEEPVETPPQIGPAEQDQAREAYRVRLSRDSFMWSGLWFFVFVAVVLAIVIAAVASNSGR